MTGWFMAGSKPGEYDHGVVEGEQFEGKRVAFLRCKADAPSGFGTLMQQIAAKEYVGKRVRLSGALRTTDADGWAGLWMRVDRRTSRRYLAFDNMQNRPVKGTTDWRRYEVVLDVADEAAAVAFGTLLEGGGEARMADFRFEVVSKDAPTTSPIDDYPTVPQNLDFSVGDN